MKITSEHYKYMENAINKYLADHGKDKIIAAYESGDFPHSEKVKDLQTRFCFDLLHDSGLTKWVCDNIYSYAHDEHIHTALKKICPTVVRRY